jgi:hypothetical protein
LLKYSKNRVMERERERRELEKSNSQRSSQRQSLNDENVAEDTTDGNVSNENKAETNSNQQLQIPPQIGDKMTQSSESHLFKKLLVACCDSCQRRASLIPVKK